MCLLRFKLFFFFVLLSRLFQQVQYRRASNCPVGWLINWLVIHLSTSEIIVRLVLFDFSLTVKAAPHECVVRTSQP